MVTSSGPGLSRSAASSALLIAFFVFGRGPSFAWEIRSDIPDTVEVGQPIVLDIVTWIPNTECHACRGHEVEHGDLSADVYVATERTQPWAHDCNGYETSCYDMVESARWPASRLLPTLFVRMTKDL